VSLASFFADATRDAVVRAVQEVESVTSAELVVVVRVRSGRYPQAHARCGAVVAFIALLLLLFLPQEFALVAIPVNVAFGFALGWAISRFTPPVERLFATRGEMLDRTRLAARAELVDGGITETSGRTGLLVYVSALEGLTQIVGDVAVQRVRSDPGIRAVEERIVDAAHRRDPAAFVEALRALGPALATPLPRSADDVNELADGVRA
jgi:putative membrane protein